LLRIYPEAMIKVKVCGMCDPLNVKEIGEAKPDFMGFIFFSGSPRYVGEDPDMTLYHNVPHNVKKIGVFMNEGNHKILDLSIRNGLDMIQLHGNESPVSCLQLKSAGLSVIKAFNIDQKFSFGNLRPFMLVCDYFLFDTKSEKQGGSGRKFNWGMLQEYSLDKPFFLGGGIGPEDTGVIKTLGNKGFFGVDINSRFEITPGIKDPVRVSTFINEIRNARI
jgi:phosphoribosylanthranilate isomerase